MPSMFSITTLWLSPMPERQPALAGSIDGQACWAIADGCRGYVGTTEVPSSMRGTSRPTIASAVNASWPKMLGTQIGGEAVGLCLVGLGDHVVDRAVVDASTE